jgi:hypothetical protein
MKRFGLTALAAAVVVMIGALLWQLRAGDGSPGKTAATGERPAAVAWRPAAAAAPAPAKSVAAPGPRPQLAGEDEIPLPVPDGTDESQQLLAGDVPQKILAAAAADCYRDEPGRFERMRLEYHLRILGGTARISDVSLVSSDLGAPRLEGCIVELLSELSWSIPDAPDLEERLEIAISLLDLQKRSRNR